MRRHILLWFALGLVTIATRVWTQWNMPLTPTYTECELVAASLARGEGWSGAFGDRKPTAHVAPLYPFILSGVYRLHGDNETTSGQLAQRILSLLIAVIVVMLLPVLARKLGFSEVVAWSGAFIAAVQPAYLWHEVTGHHEQTVAALAMVGLVWALADLHQAGWVGRRRLACVGVLLGLTALLCPNLLLIPVLFGAMELFRGVVPRRRLLRSGTILVLSTMLFIVPWLVRNFLVLGAIVPLRSNMGLELAIGNREGATGHTYAEGFLEAHPHSSESERARLHELGELPYMREKRQQAERWIAEHPPEFGKLTMRRMVLILITPDERWMILDGRLRPLARTYAFIGIMALAELLRLVRRGHPAGKLLACTILGFGVPYFFTHVEQRYRVPIIGLYALLACSGTWALVNAARRRWKEPRERSSLECPPRSRAA